MELPARRKCLSMIAAVTNQGKVRFLIYPGGLSPQRLIAFMQRLINDARRKVFLILDNLNVHKSKPVREWLAEHHRERIEVFYLPPKDVKDLKKSAAQSLALSPVIAASRARLL